jgi:hypothetical protein
VENPSEWCSLQQTDVTYKQNNLFKVVLKKIWSSHYTWRLCSVKNAESKEAMTRCNLAESSKEGYCSKTNVSPMMMMIMMTTTTMMMMIHVLCFHL